MQWIILNAFRVEDITLYWSEMAVLLYLVCLSGFWYRAAVVIGVEGDHELPWTGWSQPVLAGSDIHDSLCTKTTVSQRNSTATALLCLRKSSRNPGGTKIAETLLGMRLKVHSWKGVLHDGQSTVLKDCSSWVSDTRAWTSLRHWPSVTLVGAGTTLGYC